MAPFLTDAANRLEKAQHILRDLANPKTTCRTKNCRSLLGGATLSSADRAQPRLGIGGAGNTCGVGPDPLTVNRGRGPTATAKFKHAHRFAADMKVVLTILTLLGALSLRAEELPKALTVSRYQPMIERSPFALATAAAAPATVTADFAKDLYVANAARSPDGDLVTIASSSDKNFKRYLTTNEPVDGFTISAIEWSDKVGATKVTLSKDGQSATLTFNQALLSQPLASSAPAEQPQNSQPQHAAPRAAAAALPTERLPRRQSVPQPTLPAAAAAMDAAPVPPMPSPPQRGRGDKPRRRDNAQPDADRARREADRARRQGDRADRSQKARLR